MTERGKRPHSTSVLERWAQEFAETHGLVKKRVQDWISYMILASKIEGSSGTEGAPTFVIKGGVALEMRLRDRARATRDLDLIVVVTDADDLMGALRGALEGPYQGFTFRVKDDPYSMEDGSVRVEVVLEYRERGWGTVRVDLSPAEEHRAERFAHVLHVGHVRPGRDLELDLAVTAGGSLPSLAGQLRWRVLDTDRDARLDLLSLAPEVH